MRLLAAVLCPVLVSSVLAQAPGGLQPPLRTTDAGATLPVEVAADLATDLPGLLVDAPTPDTTWALGERYKARVTAEGLQFHALPGPDLPLVPVQLRLQRVTIGALELPLATEKRADDGTTCTLDHQSLRERLDLRAEGVEQSFHFDALPARGELVIRIGVATELPVQPQRDCVQFGAERHGVHYGAAVAFDGSGRRRALPSTWTDGALQIVVPADFVAAAQLPLVVDPLVSAVAVSAWTASSSFSLLRGFDHPDVSFDPVNGRWLVVWHRRTAADDSDIFGRMFDTSWTAVGSLRAIDISTANWERPAVAYRAKHAEWIVVSNVVHHPSWSKGIVVRRVPVIGPMLAWYYLQPIASTSLLALFDGPVVGADPYVGAEAAVSVVAWWDLTGVRFCTIDDNWVVGPIRTLSTGGSVSEVAISKSNREGRWLLGWTERVAVDAMTVSYRHSAAFLDFYGNLIPVGGGATSFPVAVTPDWHAVIDNGLRVSSPDLQGAYTVAYQRGSPSRVFVHQITADGTVGPANSLESLAPGWGAPGLDMGLETDGVRTLAVKMEGSGVRGVLLAADPTSGAFTSHDDFVTSGTLGTTAVGVASEYLSRRTDQITPFAIATAHVTGAQTRIELVGYRGYSPAQGYTTVATACGSLLPIQHNSVPPAIGNTIQVNLLTTFPMVGFLFGRPTWMPLTGICPCGIGVSGTVIPGPTATIPVPLDVSIVGSLWSIQGFTQQSGPCFGTVSYSNTIDIRIL
ncbi:MAG: hypothetical protein MUC36_09075 [Planctomycetes bacterium]|jgi:hypothetical protein|nr:hypothetical protein [Planctomycetota bacterium]